MIKFMAGLIVGLAISTAYADGYMFGWTVKVGKATICEDPYIWRSIKEIECD